MKKLNNKGYMLVEIILASVIAFSVAYYLINLTFKFKDQNLDLYNLTLIENAKINITKNIMEDINQTGATANIITLDTLGTTTCDSIPLTTTCDSSTGVYYTCDSDEQIIKYRKIALSNNNQLTYYSLDEIATEESIYTKTLDNGNEFTGIDCSGYPNRYIKIGITNIYSDEIEYIKLTW